MERSSSCAHFGRPARPGVAQLFGKKLSVEPGAMRVFRLDDDLTARCPWEGNRSRSVGELRKASAKLASHWAPINQLSPCVPTKKVVGNVSSLRVLHGSPGSKLCVLPKISSPSSTTQSQGPSPTAGKHLKLRVSPSSGLPSSLAGTQNLKESLLALVLDLPPTPKPKMSVTPASSSSAPLPSLAMSPLFAGGSIVEDLALRFGDGVIPEGERVRVQQIFSRFVTPGTSDVDRGCLHDMLVDLGYVLVTAEEVNRLASQISKFSTVDAFEFGELLEQCAASESQSIQAAFENHAEKSRHAVDVHALAALLRDCGSIVSQVQVDEALSVAGLSGRSNVRLEEFVWVLAAHRAAEGFSRTELLEAGREFERLAARRPGNQDVLELQPGEFAVDGLTQICGLHATHAGRQLMERMGAISGERGLRMHEFLALARRLREVELAKLWSAFVRFDCDCDGLLNVEDFALLLKELGFTLLHSAREEVLANAGLTMHGRGFSFDEAARFVDECRRTYGFDCIERSELEDLFHQFDSSSSGKMQTMQMLDLLRFMGHSRRVDDMHRLIREFDANANGTIELMEYMHLMRMHREAELLDTRRVFDEYQDGFNQMPSENLADALEEMGHEIELENLSFPEGMPDSLSFDDFAQVSDQSRKHATLLKHKRADFSPAELALIGEVYNERKGSSGTVGKGELLWLLAEYNIPVTTSDGRQRVFGLLDQAREAAIASGNKENEAGEKDDSVVGFWTFVHLLRVIARETEGSRAAREDSAIRETLFSPTEVASFRDVFAERCVSCAAPAAPTPMAATPPPMQESLSATAPLAGALARNRGAARRSSVSSIPLAASLRTTGILGTVLGFNRSRTHLTIPALHALLKRIGLRPAPEQAEALQAKVDELREREVDGGLDFAGFLLLMRWMLDNNFASVCAVAAQAAKRLERPGSVSPVRARRSSAALRRDSSLSHWAFFSLVSTSAAC